MCGHRDQVSPITFVILLPLIWCMLIFLLFLANLKFHQDGCKTRNYINETEICITPCHEKILIAVTLNLYLYATNSKFIANHITATTSDSSVLKVVTQDNIYWSIFMNEKLLSNESVPTEGYRFDGWSLNSLGKFKVLDGGYNRIHTLSDTTVAPTTAGEIISYKPNSKT